MSEDKTYRRDCFDGSGIMPTPDFESTTIFVMKDGKIVGTRRKYDGGE